MFPPSSDHLQGVHINYICMKRRRELNSRVIKTVSHCRLWNSNRICAVEALRAVSQVVLCLDFIR